MECLAPELVADQIRAAIGDIPPAAAKTGALGNREIVETVAALARDFAFPLIVDPVMTSKNGAALLAGDAIDAFKTFLLPNAFLLTPNLDEVTLLTGMEVRGEDGAVVVFDGIVRDNSRGRSTLHLDYEAYEEMAAKQMDELAREALNRFGVRHVIIVHRLGRLLVGETSVLIVVASAHRAQAYEASRWLIDTLKKTVPIWKKETFVDGSVWADGEPFPPGVGVEAADAT